MNRQGSHAHSGLMCLWSHAHAGPAWILLPASASGDDPALCTTRYAAEPSQPNSSCSSTLITDASKLAAGDARGVQHLYSRKIVCLVQSSRVTRMRTVPQLPGLQVRSCFGHRGTPCGPCCSCSLQASLSPPPGEYSARVQTLAPPCPTPTAPRLCGLAPHR